MLTGINFQSPFWCVDNDCNFNKHYTYFKTYWSVEPEPSGQILSLVKFSHFSTDLNCSSLAQQHSLFKSQAKPMS